MKEDKRRLRIVLGLVVLLGLGAFYGLSRPKVIPKELVLEPGTIYYKGPMRAKGRKDSVGVDTLNPDILENEPLGKVSDE